MTTIQKDKKIHVDNILVELQKILDLHKNEHQLSRTLENKAEHRANETSSYTQQLYHSGLNKIGKKIAEEAGEVIMAAKDCEYQNTERNQQLLVNEITDLWFHCMVLLTYYDGNVEQILQEILKRFGTSGITEKQSRR